MTESLGLIRETYRKSEPAGSFGRLGFFRLRNLWLVATLPLLGCGSLGSEPQDWAQRLASQPLDIRVEARQEQGQRILRLSLDDRRWNSGGVPRLALDHGKWVHMFLIAEPDLNAFAHVHPRPVDESEFDVALPPLPSGTYRVYVDLLHTDGTASRSTELVHVPPQAEESGNAGRALRIEPDEDDSWGLAESVKGDIYKFADGHFMIWDRDVSLVAGQFVPLRFTLLRPDGGTAEITPYMGMLSHVALRDRDTRVFGHLHAMDDKAGMDDEAMASMMANHQHDGLTSYPSIGLVAVGYVFPAPGTYRLWVQIKSVDKVYTGIFDLKVRGA